MNILTAWKDSLSIFYPWSNFKQFCSAVWQELKVDTPLFFKKFWLLIALILFDMYTAETTGNGMKHGLTGITPVLLIMLALFIAPYCLVWHKKSMSALSMSPFFRTPFLMLLYFFSLVGLYLGLKDFSVVVIASIATFYFFMALYLLVWHRNTTKSVFWTIIYNLPAAAIFMLPLFWLLKMHGGNVVVFLQIPFKIFETIPPVSQNMFLLLITFSLITFCILNLLYASIWRVFYVNRSKQLDS